MKSIFDPADISDLRDRMTRLKPDSRAEWGKMNVGQMLAHVQAPLQVALGELKLKRSMAGRLFGSIARKRLAGDQPFGRNLPTDNAFVVSDAREVERERTAVLALLQRLLKIGKEGLSTEPHPFFGKLTPQEWDNLMWKHLDHHLRQFGV
jgi:hypothetical protein